MANAYSKEKSAFKPPKKEKEKKVPKPINRISEKKKAELEASGPDRKDFTGNRLYSVKDLKKLQKEVARTNRERKPKKVHVDKEKKLWDQFSIYIRVRDADEKGMCKCITTGKPVHWTKADCGHGIGRQHRATKYHEQNNHAQSRKHNRFEEGRKDLYSKEVDKRYGPGTWNRLEVLSKTTLKEFSKEEIDRLASHYKSLADQIKKEKGL